jgi:uncharacterized RDD family membrane protein YckC
MEVPRLPYVGVGRRAVAQIIDWIFSLIWFLPFAVVEHSAGGGLRLSWYGWRAATPWLITLLYFVVLEGLLGATVGKFLTGIRVVRDDGTKLAWSASLVRNLLRVVDAIPYVLPYLLGAVVMWTGGERKQRVGDRAAHTVVIRSNAIPLQAAPGMPDTVDLGAGSGEAPPLPPPPPDA